MIKNWLVARAQALRGQPAIDSGSEFERGGAVAEASASPLSAANLAEVASEQSVSGETSPTAERRPSTDQFQYSRAFENFVEDSKDLVGLLAYSYYKESIREDARRGRVSSGQARNPNRPEVMAFRSRAERELSAVARRAIDDATPDIEQTATANAIINNKTEIMAHISSKTGFWNAFATNMLAWIATIFIAATIIYLSGRPSIEQVLSNNLEDQPSLGIGPAVDDIRAKTDGHANTDARTKSTEAK